VKAVVWHRIAGERLPSRWGGYPQQLEGQEEPNARSMMRAIDHPVEA